MGDDSDGHTVSGRSEQVEQHQKQSQLLSLVVAAVQELLQGLTKGTRSLSARHPSPHDAQA